MLIKDPWGNTHRVNDKYDNDDIDVATSYEFKGMIPTDQLTKNNFTMNRASTRVNESRDVTLKVKGSAMRTIAGLKMGKTVRNW